MNHKPIINRNRLLGLVAEHKMNKRSLCVLLDISYTTLQSKLTKGKDFSETEIAILHDNFGEEIFLH